MDITQRQITKIAREAGKFTSRTIKEEGVGTAELTSFMSCGKDRASPNQKYDLRADMPWPSRLPIWRQRATPQRQSNPSDGAVSRIHPTEQAQRLEKFQGAYRDFVL